MIPTSLDNNIFDKIRNILLELNFFIAGPINSSPKSVFAFPGAVSICYDQDDVK